MNKNNIIARVIALAFALFLISNVFIPVNFENAYAEEIPVEALSYYGIPGYFGYWYEDWNEGYFYQEWGTAAKKTLPDMSLDDVWLEDVVVTTVNVPIDKVVNRVVVYKSAQDDTGMTVGSPNDMDYYTSSYSNVRQLEQTPKPDGTTDVNLVIDLSVLSKDRAQEIGSVYKTYIHFVVEYVEKAYVDNPEKWKEEHLGSGNIDVTVQYKDEDGSKLINDKTRKTSLGANLIENSERIDGYRCTGYSVTGKETKSFSGNSTSFVVGLFNYSTPKNNSLNITFNYEEYEEPEKPKCDPQFDAKAEDARITMKRQNFENAIENDTDIFFSNIRIGVDDFEGGHRRVSATQWEEVEGEHEFHSFDIYLRYPDTTSGYDFTRYDIYSQSVLQSINIPASKFTATNEQKTEYVANVDVLLGVLCTCGGFNAERTTLSLYVDIVENQPPSAYYRYATKKMLPSGDKSRVYNKAFIGKDVVIDNYCDDPNGLTDIEFVRYIFKNKNNPEQVKSIQLKMMPWGAYKLGEYDLFDDTSIYFTGIENGNLGVIFTNDEEWEISVYVQDTEGLKDTYTNTIKPEELTLKPTAVIKDTSSYRYPYGEEFNGKQNRVIKLDSNSSCVASWLKDMKVEINHDKDMWGIEPLDGQDINSIKFGRGVNKYINGDTLNVSYDPLDIKIMFKEAGRYKIRLQVADTEGNVSDWSEQVITIHEDSAPTVTANINPKYYRNASKNAVITFNSLPASNDYDYPEVESIRYKFDSDNDGSFADETLQTAGATHKDVNIDGIIYRKITFTANKVGKYQFEISVKEDFGQETIDKYISAEDYKTANISVITEVDNIAPVASLGLQKENNIDVKILTSGLTGTRNQDVQNNLSNLKNWIESENNIKVGSVEVVDMGKTIDAINNGLTWKKVLMTGLSSPKEFWYTQDETTGERIKLPSKTYATGWNGIPIPKVFIHREDLFDKEDWYILPNDTEYRDVLVRENFYDFVYGEETYGNKDQYKDLYVEMGYLEGSNWDRILANVDAYSTVTDNIVKDFDITFEFDYKIRGWPGHPIEPHYVVEHFLFNVQDQNNYFTLLHHELNDREFEKLEQYYDYPWELIQVKNGKAKTLKKFSSRELESRYKDDGEWETEYHPINRVVQKGNLIELYRNDRKKVYSINIDEHMVGGRLGLGAEEGKYYGLTLKSAKLSIKNLTFIENASIYDSLGQLSWKENSDKYVINLVEGKKVEELTDSTQLNKTAAKLQAEEINLINIGVNSVNGTKLKELTTKNQNNGTYIELGNIYNNLNSAAAYIKNKDAGQTTADEYLLLGDKVYYAENYSDAENDSVFSKEYKYYHNYNYFQNNLGAINNNNSWQENQINTFNKTGKYTLSYRAKDNPLYPDLSIENLFNSYRKYSSVSNKNIYVHRKPIASFNIDKSFKDNALIKTTLTLQDLRRIYPHDGEEYYVDADVDYDRNMIFMRPNYLGSNEREEEYATFEVNIPSDAIDAVMTYHIENVRYKKNGDSIVEEEDISEDLTSGIFRKEFSLTGSYYGRRATVSEFKIEYYQPNPNVKVKIVENSYDIDHKSLSNKGITEWQWKIIDKNGVTTEYKTINRATGVTWIQNALSANQKWADASVQLRVKDMEGVYSDWTENYIDEGVIHDPVITKPEVTQKKPIADFIIDKNPLKLGSEIQNIYDNSYDTEGLALSYVWNIKKDGTALFTSVQKNIDTQLNQIINKNGIGIYDISLTVTNTKGIQSGIATKNFEVIVYNQAPTADFDLISNESPAWSFPKILGLHTLRYRPTNSFFHEEKTKFNVNVKDPNTDNTGFAYDWKLERFAVKDIKNISGTATNTYNYTKQYPFTNSFEGQGLKWGAYRITLSVTDKPPVPPYALGDEKTAAVTKQYYILPKLSLTGSYKSANTEIMVGDTITLKAKTSKETENTTCTLKGTKFILNKVSEDSSFAYWEKNITIPDSITESGTYQLQFVGNTTYGGNGSITREVRDTVSLNIIALKLINFRITDIVNHPDITFPYTKDMLINKLISYKAGYYVTFKIDSKGKPDQVYGRIDVGDNGSINQVVNMTKVASGNTETWQGRFYTDTKLDKNTVISIKLDCKKGATSYNYNEKESWNGRSLITNGSALMDGRVNLTN